MRHTPIRSMFWRRTIVILLLLTQFFVTAYYIYSRSQTSQIINGVLLLVSVAVAFYVSGKQDKPDYKQLWIMIILVFPIFGGTFYLLFNYQVLSRLFQKNIMETNRLLRPLFLQKEGILPLVSKEWPDYAPQMYYLEDYAGFPVYSHTATKFLDSGEAFFEHLLIELDKADQYIFVESFILNEGRMLNTILDKLESKVKEGVQVRIMYDDIGCFLTLPKNYKKTLTARGFDCTVFNPFRPVLSSVQNNRDHRKIISIDGKTAFTGGINLADEYINEYEKYGHWRDSAVMLRGEAAWSLTLIFLQLWNASKKNPENPAALYPWGYEPCPEESDGYVQPYADSPLDDENVGEHVYKKIINSAKDYLYINTPYLIIDNSLISALKLSAKSGVDIRIITPHIWDKRLVHFTTRSYYRELISAGVRIYEYSRGFNHSKTFVSDDKIATVGTTNLDYRSLYLHFECGAVLYGSRAIKELKEDFLKTLPECQQITPADCKGNALIRMLQEVLRIFAPLM